MTYDELYKKIEKIVRDDGDETLKIDEFIRKMKSELEFHRYPEKVAEINFIPLELILEIQKIDKKDLK